MGKEMDVFMKLDMKEKRILYVFGCPNLRNTVERMKWLTSLAVDPEAKHRMLELTKKIEDEAEEEWYHHFYHYLRSEMDSYFQAKRYVRIVEMRTEYGEEMYGEAV